MSTENMPMFDSLSFALLIPFAICFILIFLVCCFADEIKDICRMPSPLPASYLAAQHTRPSRHSRRPRQRQSDEARNLILSEEGRSRNVSESSNDHTATNMAALSSISLHGHTVTRIQPSVSNARAVVSGIPDCDNHTPQTRQVVPSSHHVGTVKDFTCVAMQPAPHSVIHSNHSNIDTRRNFLRNLSMNSSVLTVNIAPYSCANLSDGKSANTSSNCCNATKNTNTEQSTSIVRNKSAPHTLNKYLTSVLPHASISQMPQNTESRTHDDCTVTYHESTQKSSE